MHESLEHLGIDELQRGFSNLASQPHDAGRLALIVIRRGPGDHESLDRARLSAGEGVAGDRWALREDRRAETQIAVMRRDVAELVANGQPLTLFGDNLLVDLDISTDNLPPGTRIQVGPTIVEVTPEPHNGCSLFRKRFGDAALRFVQAAPTRRLNLRGIYWRVIEPGEIAVGQTIQVLTRPD